MYHYLSDITADYDYTLSLANENVMPEYGDKKQVVHTYDDGGISVTRMSDTSRFNVRIEFTAMTTTDSDTLLSLWHDTSKANGRENTFYWLHPITGKYYTVRFMDIVTKNYRSDYGTAYLGVDSIVLKIEGNKPT